MKFVTVKNAISRIISSVHKFHGGKTFLLTVFAGMVGGVLSTLITYSYIDYKQKEKGVNQYFWLKSEIKAECEEFKYGVLAFAGYKDRFQKNNIYRVPGFAFSLLKAVQSDRQLFLDQEGKRFIKILSEFSKLEKGYDGIQATKQKASSANSFNWHTSTWSDYYRPATQICGWVGIDLKKIKPKDGM